MKIKTTTRISTAAKLLAGVLFATCVFTAAANAQPSVEGKFTLPYEVHWNHTVLPAGEYAIQVYSDGTPAVLRSTSSGKSVYRGRPIIGDGQKGASSLTITIRGNERRVRSVNLPQFGMSLIFDPLSKTEREMFAKAGQIETLPMFTAQK
jgi:hypothetical protein